MESRSPNIVAGEASETDDDELEGIPIAQGFPHLSPLHVAATSSGDSSAPPYTFAREAVESSSSSAAVSDEELQRLQARRAMNERCVALLNEFVHNTVASVSKQLNEADSFLMKSQMVLQNVTTAVRKTNENTHQMQAKLQHIVTSNFVPNINI